MAGNPHNNVPGGQPPNNGEEREGTEQRGEEPECFGTPHSGSRLDSVVSAHSTLPRRPPPVWAPGFRLVSEVGPQKGAGEAQCVLSHLKNTLPG